MNNPESLVPALYKAPDADHAAKLLESLELEELKPIAREVCGMRRFNGKATAEGLRFNILRQLEARAASVVTPVTIGDTITDADSGEEVIISEDFQAQVMEINHRLMQAQFSIQKGMVDVCRAVKDFRDAKGYLLSGYHSFKAYCDAGELRVMGETKSRAWAYNMIAFIEKLGGKVVQRAGQLPQRDLLRLTMILGEPGMEDTLEELQSKGRLRYIGDDGQEVVLQLPKSAEDTEGWKTYLEFAERERRRNRRQVNELSDEMLLAREEHEKEIQALRDRIAELEGRTDEEIAALLEKEELTPQEAATLKNDLRNIRADRASLESRNGDLSERLERYHREGVDMGGLEKVRKTCAEFRGKVSDAIELISPLLPHAGDLSDLAVQEILEAIYGENNKLGVLSSRFDEAGE